MPFELTFSLQRARKILSKDFFMNLSQSMSMFTHARLRRLYRFCKITSISTRLNNSRNLNDKIEIFRENCEHEYCRILFKADARYFKIRERDEKEAEEEM